MARRPGSSIREASRKMKATPTTTVIACDTGVEATAQATAAKKRPVDYDLVAWLGRLITRCKKEGIVSADNQHEFKRFMKMAMKADYPPPNPWHAPTVSDCVGAEHAGS